MLQVLLYKANYSVKHYSFICTQSNASNCCYVIPRIQFKHLVKEINTCYLTLIILVNITHSFAHSKYLQILLSNTIILFTINHLFAHTYIVSSTST